MKKSILVISLLSIGAIFALNSCNNKEKKESSNEIIDIAFKDTFIELDAFQSKNIDVKTSYNGKIEFYTEDDKIAKVIDNQIVGISGGNTILYAKINDASIASTKIFVYDDGEVPFIEIDDNVNLFANSQYTLNPTVLFHGQNQEATYKYEVDDNGIIEVDENGKISAKQIGDANVTITASYLSFSGNEFDFLKKTIDVHVSEEIILQLNVSNDSISYQNVVIDGINYSNEATLSGTLYLNGTTTDLFDANVTFTSTDENVITVNKNKIVGHNIGNASIYASYTTNNGTYTSNVLDIEVNKPTIKNNVVYDIDLSLENLSFGESFLISEDEVIKQIYDINDKNTNIYDQKKLVNYDKLGYQTWILETDKYRYQTDVVCCSKIIYDAAELKKLHTYSKNLQKGTKGVVSFEGYYILGNDIDMNNQALLKNVSYDFGATSVQSSGFIGTFDGRGYTIKNAVVSASYAGLFGTLNRDSVVKNVCFENAKITGNSGLISSYCGGTITNCYIKGQITGSGNETFPKSLLVGQVLPECKITNCIVEVNKIDDNSNFAVAVGRYYGAKESVFENVYVINTKQKVLSTQDQGVYETFKSPVNGQFDNYEEFLNNVSLDVFDDYWHFGEDGIEFSSSL